MALVPAVLLLCSRVGDQLFYKRCLLFSVQVINLASRIGPLIQVRLSYNICFERKTQTWLIYGLFTHFTIITYFELKSPRTLSSPLLSSSSSSSSLQHDHHFWQYCLEHRYGRCHQSAFECDYLMRKKRICLGEKRNRKMLTNILQYVQKRKLPAASVRYFYFSFFNEFWTFHYNAYCQLHQYHSYYCCDEFHFIIIPFNVTPHSISRIQSRKLPKLNYLLNFVQMILTAQARRKIHQVSR